MNKCPKCGHPHMYGTKICVNCGYHFNPEENIANQTQAAYNQQNTTKPKKSTSLFGGVFKGKENEQLKQNILLLQQENQELKQKLQELGFTEYTQTQAAINTMQKEIEQDNITISLLRQEIATLTENREKEEKKLKTASNKLNKTRELYKSIEYSIENYPNFDVTALSISDSDALEELSPSVILKLHHMDVKDLRKAYRENEKQIERLLILYAARYTTKANQTIYQLMVIALRAELQNILYGLKFEKLDDAVEQVKDVTRKYLAIAGQGNQNIVSTLTKFIGEIEYLFINAVKIEYNYYVKKEQARQEQLAIREQMRQEAEERRALEQEKKKIDAEETKYKAEIERIKEQMTTAARDEAEKLQSRIVELQAQLADVVVKKETITNLQNGKAGNVYIISNLGSFGDNMFKIGMTRRLDPQERIDELGSASVPFKFDVHSFIFSEDAVALEKNLHDALSDKRVNKVNLRKEFFYTTVDELEQLVSQIDSTAEFNKTMIAEEYRQSLSTDEAYNTDYYLDDEE
ncbi:MAG: GIY-YIG nuclease family protein [Candidatus Fimenecus sp.]